MDNNTQWFGSHIDREHLVISKKKNCDFTNKYALVISYRFRWKPQRRSLVAMYEGKNIHFSTVDNKPLCSFSSKVCNQRRLNGYAFCVRHILEDPTAPFRRCAYVAKSSKQTCTQPIPQHEEREYCNNHMQVLGMLPKKERKPKKEREKEKDKGIGSPKSTVPTENRLFFPTKNKARLSEFKPQVGFDKGSSIDDPEDPYAFPADPPVNEPPEKLNHSNSLQNSISSPSSCVNTSSHMFSSYHQAGAKSPAENNGQSTLAKMYPELAEKLENSRPKVEPKVKGKVKISRTMTSLQTKIAQNKIKDKLKKNQESSSTSSQSQSPSHGFNNANSPGLGGNSLSVNCTTASTSLSISLPITVSATTTNTTVHSNVGPNLNLQGLNLGNLSPLNLQLPSLADPSVLEHTLQQLAKASQIPLDVAFLRPEGLPRINSGLPAGALLPPEFLGFHHFLRPPFIPHTAPPPYPSLPSSPQSQFSQVGPPNVTLTTPVMPLSSPSVPSILPITTTVESPVTHEVHMTPLITSVPSTVTATVTSSSPSSSETTVTDSVKTMATRTLVHTKVPKNTVTVKSKTCSKVRTVSSSFDSSVTLVHPRKVQNILSEDDIKQKLKRQSAVDYYGHYVKRKIHNHDYLCTGLSSSDEDSDDCDMLPWQPYWFIASSDEEANEEDEQDDLRTAKLALTRARIRRKFFQSRKSYRSNSSGRKQLELATQALVDSACDSQPSTMKALFSILQKTLKPPDKYKRRGLERRQCCYKNDEEVQCKNPVLPYTNHCLRHVMYNVDQQMFDYCTAKFSDNTQCCVPVFDIKHELPLCMEHGIKADNYQKVLDAEPKPKRPRKKTKPSALTRPPKKGKKKKNQRKLRPQKPLPPEEPTGDTEMPETVPDDTMLNKDESLFENGDKLKDDQKDLNLSTSSVQQSVGILGGGPSQKLSTSKGPDQGEDLENLDNFSSEFDKYGELPLETASKILEEHDFQEVFNRLPDEAFDLFAGKNGDFEPTKEEVEELEKSLLMASNEIKRVKDSLENFPMNSNSNLPPILEEADELTKQIAEEILSQGIHPDSNLNEQQSSCIDAQESIRAIARSLSTSEIGLVSQATSALSYIQSGYINQSPNMNFSQSHLIASPSVLQGRISQAHMGQGEVQGQSQQRVLSQGQHSVIQGQTLTSLSTNHNQPSISRNVSLPPQVGNIHLDHSHLVQPFGGPRNLYNKSSLNSSLSSLSTTNQSLNTSGYHDTLQLTPQQIIQQLSQHLQLSPQQLSQLTNQHPRPPLPQSQISLQSTQQQMSQQQQQQQIRLTQNNKGQSSVVSMGTSGLLPTSHVGWAPRPDIPLNFPNGFPVSFLQTQSTPAGVRFTMTAQNINPTDLKQLDPPQISQFPVTSPMGNVQVSQSALAGFDNLQGLPVYTTAPIFTSSQGNKS
ncbi:hypothetical protein CHS0354_032102 [Potamilus streckersoni]|uniref:KANL2-like probable zinc-finger domain-containing protein n=1 Tax=Potamilus streckersoni TaxID=2493646 RepID=A0AAE0RM02_9BIVA|nr:hypothetical protein CHS0354_032102 [Potamilus streckersoni]